MPRFIVQFQGQESFAEVKPGANSVGRQSSCTIPLKDSTLSRLHCEVILAGTVATLVDKGSRNGTLLNGKKIDAQVLQPGDKIQIGATTLWYEKKNVASEAPRPAASSAPSTRRTAAPAPAPQSDTGVRKTQSETGVRKAQADTGVRKAQADTGVRKPPTAALRPSAPAEPTEPRLKDYAFHGKAGGNTGKIVAAVLVMGLLGAAGVFGRNYIKLPNAPVDDSENIVARNAHFDVLGRDGKPDGWGMRPSMAGEKSSSSASVAPARGRNGGPCLLLDKAGGASDLVAECAFQEDVSLARGAYLAASAWTQFENFNGWAALKVDWLRSPKGAVIAEEYSDPVKPAGWTQIKATFNPPAGAGAFRFALAIVGRSGRVFFDDVSVKFQAGAPPPPEKKIGQYHKIYYTRAGVLQIEMRGGRRALTNISVRLESEKEGATAQAFSTDVTASSEEGRLGFKGRMVNPLDFREVAFEERIGENDEMTNVEYQFAGDALKQVDRVTIALTLPRVDGPPRNIPESGDPTSSITCGSEDGDFAIEYRDPAYVKYRNIDGRFRVYQTWKVDAQAEDPVFIFRIREAGNGPVDPRAAWNKMRTDKKFGEALALARDQAKKAKEPVVREGWEADIKSLELQERRAWAETQAQVFQGRISRRDELVAIARAALEKCAREWKGEGTEGKVDVLARDFEKELKSTPAGEAEWPRRILERAKKCVEGGKRALAQSLLQTLVTRYPSSDVKEEAQQLLKSLSE
jgi:pSer/pThr/pTyr-binding forkhead associated (FHA) protein